MKQIIVRRMTLGDLIANLFYKVRYWSYRKLFKWKLKNISPKTKEGLELTFEDDFNEVSWGSKTENKKWIVAEDWGPYHPRKTIHYYGPPTLLENTSLAKFTVDYNPKTFQVPERWQEEIGSTEITIPFENSLICTPYSFRQKHGQFECRCTIPYDRGVWPAWWMYGTGWPPEIDIFELYGHKDGKKAGIQKIALHYGKTFLPEGKSSSKAWGIRIDTKKNKDKFHEFTLKWSDKKIECFTDSVKVFRYSRKEILDKWFNGPDVDMQLLVNHGLQESYVERDEEDYYSEFFVDYVRAYKNI